MTGVRELHTELAAEGYRYLNSGIRPSQGEDEDGACMNLLDPFGNTLRIDERTAE